MTVYGCNITQPINPMTKLSPNPTFPKTSGTFIYCNSPEVLDSSGTMLGDPTLGNKYLLWSRVTGTCYAYYEHSNQTNNVIGYGIQLFNPSTTSTVSVTITNQGFSAQGNRLDLWNQFLSGQSSGYNLIGTYPIGPRQSFWVHRNDYSVFNNTVFEGAVQFTVSGGYVNAFNYAYVDFNAINGTATYLPWVTTSRLYKGTASGIALNAGISATTTNLSKNIPLFWETHGCTDKFPDACQTDILPIVVPLGDVGSSSTQTISCPGGNLANWGVPYRYTLNVTNPTSTTVPVKFQLYIPPQSGTTEANVYVATTNEGGVNYECTINSLAVNDVMSFNAYANTTTTRTFTVFLGGNSSGGLKNLLCLA